METYKIGTKVFYFEDKLRGDFEIKEDTVYGAFVSRATGDLYYYLSHEQYPAFCVADTIEKAEELRAKYKEYAEAYMEQVDTQTAKYNEFKAPWYIEELHDKAKAE